MPSLISRFNLIFKNKLGKSAQLIVIVVRQLLLLINSRSHKAVSKKFEGVKKFCCLRERSERVQNFSRRTFCVAVGRGPCQGTGVWGRL